MKIVPTSFSLLLFLGSFLVGVSGKSEEGWIELFDGETTKGWQMNADEGACRVVDGALRLQATDPKNRGHLFYVGEDEELDLFREFKLEAVVKGEAKANSGIFFHTDRATRDEVLHLASSYEVQLSFKPDAKQLTGSLYDVIPLSETPVKAGEWFTVRIRVEGKRSQVWLDEAQVIDYTEPDAVVEQRSEKRKGRVLREAGGLKPVLDENQYSLDEANEANEAQARLLGGQGMGKVVVEV